MSSCCNNANLFSPLQGTWTKESGLQRGNFYPYPEMIGPFQEEGYQASPFREKFRIEKFRIENTSRERYSQDPKPFNNSGYMYGNQTWDKQKKYTL